MKFFNGLLVGIIVGAAGFWFVQEKARQHPEMEQHFQDSAAQAGSNASQAAHNLSDALKAKFDTLDLSGEQIKDEMARAGKIVRRKAQVIAGRVADAATDDKAVLAIKAKYAGDPELSVWSISVSCHDGHVTLTGTVPNSEGVARAIALALEVDGVEDVTSTLEIKSKA